MRLRGFLRDERASSFEGMALALSVIAVLFVAAADFLHYAARKDGEIAQILHAGHNEIVSLFGKDEPLRGDIDYTATGSVGALRNPPALNPCSDQQK
ncbi:hypothetical protein [uncultured Methylovirgula sp.]|uniref:hypothetical protein n=1 Tax=uncultured Methylovirgula sp. TaxID=1285960 RepID=UPI00262FE05F|nr:hypothetical protein [uncultured Methylovirgula sp.]